MPGDEAPLGLILMRGEVSPFKHRHRQWPPFSMCASAAGMGASSASCLVVAVPLAQAASAVPALVMARGHKIDEVSEIPMVLEPSFETLEKTALARKTMEKLGMEAELEKCSSSKKIRAGKGKMRNRRYVLRRGPLVVYSESTATVTRAIRNLPGVEFCQVDR
jgi:ribosomal protein L4